MSGSKGYGESPPAYTPGAPANSGTPKVQTVPQQPPEPQQPYPVAQQPQQPYPVAQQPQQPYPVAQQPQQFNQQEPQQPYPANQQFPQKQQQPYIVAQQPQMHNTVIVQAAPQILSRKSTNVVCHVCQQHIQTRTDSHLKSEAWVWAAVLCCLGGLLCVWIPFVLDSSYSVTHTCPSCNTMLGRV